MIRAKPHRRAMQRRFARLALSIGLAATAFAVVQTWVADQAAVAAEAQRPQSHVLVTTRPIEPGTILTMDDLRWQPWPRAAVDTSWLVRPDTAAAAAATPVPMLGTVVSVRLAAGVPITAAMATAAGSGSAFAAAIRPGWRAASIAVTPAAGLAGFVAPGDRVDVLLTQTLGNRRTAQTLVADLTVLGVDQRQRGDSGMTAPLVAASDVVADAAGASSAEPPNLITLEVTPRQAEAIAVAAELGKLSLALRGPAAGRTPVGSRRWDSDVTGLSPAQLAAGNSSESSFVAPPPAVAAPVAAPPLAAPRASGVEIIYGTPLPAAEATR